MGFHDWEIVEIPEWLIRAEHISIVPRMRSCKRSGCSVKQKQKNSGLNKGQWYNVTEIKL